MANYFIKVDDGPEVRRRILESSKASLHVLRGYQQLLVTRGQKLTHMNTLRRELKELTVLINRAEALMPQLSQLEIEEISPRPPPKPLVQAKPMLAEKPAAPAAPEGKWVKKGSKKVFVAAPKHKVVAQIPIAPPKLDAPPEQEMPKPKMTELEKLEAALAAVESKLGKL